MEFELNTCSGCMACMNVCPKNAISTIESPEGFILPHIDKDKCVNCGLCEEVCDFIKPHKKENGIKKAFSLVVKDTQVLRNSTSGGAFTALSDAILSKGGLIFGSVMDSDFSVVHVKAINRKERDMMRGSKYVQSNIGYCYRQVKEELSEGKPVMFVGTPCQCAGLRSFLRKDYDKLIVVDFLCHGVPNNKMFKEHIAWLNNHYGIPSVGFTFREKTYGWSSYNNNNKLQNNKIKTRLINQAYYEFFIRNLSLRPACFNCVYRSHSRPSDVTIADFWQIEKFTGKKNNTGVSLVLINSEKGKALFDDAAKQCMVQEYPVKDILFRVSTTPAIKNKRYDDFWETYKKYGYEQLTKKFFDMSIKKQVKFEIRKAIKKIGLIF